MWPECESRWAGLILKIWESKRFHQLQGATSCPEIFFCSFFDGDVDIDAVDDYLGVGGGGDSWLSTVVR